MIHVIETSKKFDLYPNQISQRKQGVLSNASIVCDQKSKEAEVALDKV